MKEEILEFIEQNKDRSVTKRIQSRTAKIINTISNWETDTSKLENKNFISMSLLIISKKTFTWKSVIIVMSGKSRRFTVL